MTLLFSIFFRTPTMQVPQIVYAGSFESVAGVMDPLSCYCGTGAYVTTKTGDRVPVCFDSIAEEQIMCKNIRVSGKFVKKVHETSTIDPCLSGTQKVLEVKSYSCLK